MSDSGFQPGRTGGTWPQTVRWRCQEGDWTRGTGSGDRRNRGNQCWGPPAKRKGGKSREEPGPEEGGARARLRESQPSEGRELAVPGRDAEVRAGMQQGREGGRWEGGTSGGWKCQRCSVLRAICKDASAQGISPTRALRTLTCFAPGAPHTDPARCRSAQVRTPRPGTLASSSGRRTADVDEAPRCSDSRDLSCTGCLPTSIYSITLALHRAAERWGPKAKHHPPLRSSTEQLVETLSPTHSVPGTWVADESRFSPLLVKLPTMTRQRSTARKVTYAWEEQAAVHPANSLGPSKP